MRKAHKLLDVLCILQGIALLLAEVLCIANPSLAELKMVELFKLTRKFISYDNASWIIFSLAKGLLLLWPAAYLASFIKRTEDGIVITSRLRVILLIVYHINVILFRIMTRNLWNTAMIHWVERTMS